MKRPFVIPWGRAGVIYCVVAPIVIGAIALSASEMPVAGLISLAMGPVMYVIVRRFARPTSAEPAAEFS